MSLEYHTVTASLWTYPLGLSNHIADTPDRPYERCTEFANGKSKERNALLAQVSFADRKGQAFISQPNISSSAFYDMIRCGRKQLLFRLEITSFPLLFRPCPSVRSGREATQQCGIPFSALKNHPFHAG